ncbi:hypothetical protein Leucomu_05855 [Leucobacter muris]|uniref:Uncharacterized protein n=1 Tax=Leucobacter muris TaxID=1935379 RepID=A0ABX5QEK4_9MICO|nr:hypothetical protein [Leucobacter muris]QAB17509.1 hypothetical protein Leucomu_05855 [Leucobacter muris]
MSLLPILTRERAATMSAKELIIACAAQVDAQNPSLPATDREDKCIALIDALASEDHLEEIRRSYLKDQVEESMERIIDKTAAHLFDPETNSDGVPEGIVSYRNGIGEGMFVPLRQARPEDFERPFHLHHRGPYLAVAKLMRTHGMDNYQAAYEAGIFTPGKDAS